MRETVEVASVIGNTASCAARMTRGRRAIATRGSGASTTRRGGERSAESGMRRSPGRRPAPPSAARAWLVTPTPPAPATRAQEKHEMMRRAHRRLRDDEDGNAMTTAMSPSAAARRPARASVGGERRSDDQRDVEFRRQRARGRRPARTEGSRSRPADRAVRRAQSVRGGAETRAVRRPLQAFAWPARFHPHGPRAVRRIEAGRNGLAPVARVERLRGARCSA